MTILVAPDPSWPAVAQALCDEWRALKLVGLQTIHHIGSTSVPGLPAKPVIDLMPIFDTRPHAAAAADAVTSLGYEWLGAFGLEGRQYARRDDPFTGARQVQAHCYPQDHKDIARHLAFRDALRDNGILRAAYTREKARCAALHPGDTHSYGDCKSDWIKKAEAKALEHYV
ncbi:GrpB family protein [Ascidiaceihabitans sp.]|uniref:GrpB family protein n=1 Tax=Ascidiaceihabitans sp. TaxID=1872644 RepID=UPI0032991183